MSSQPLVSVIMNCYNGAKYLRQAIDSVLAQTHSHWEIIFWDNQSTDESAQIVASYRDSRIRYFRAPTHTMLYEARNYAIAKADGELLAFLDVDDWWLPVKLARQVPLFSDPQVGMACCNYWVEHERKKKRWVSLTAPIPCGWVLEDLLRTYFVGLLTLVVRRTALDSLAYPCDPRFHVMGDTDLVIRLAVEWKLGTVQEPLAFYRLHGNNEVVKQRSRLMDELQCWLSEMEHVPAIRSCPTFVCVKQYRTYLEAMQQILEANRRAAFRLWRGLPWDRLKRRLTLALLLPAFAVRRLKS